MSEARPASRLPRILGALTVVTLLASVPFLVLGLGIADRLAALGGSFDVRSAPGNGTTVSGRLPVAA